MERKLQKLYLIDYNLLIEQDLWQAHYQISSIISYIVWRKLKYVFMGSASMNLHLKVSIQGLFFGVSINHCIIDKPSLQSTCLLFGR